MACVFCTDPREAGEIVYEDDRVWVIVHADWAVRGHAMVVWRRHVENVADLAVPAIADWCAVDRVQEGGDIARLAVTHVNPEKVSLAQEYRRRYNTRQVGLPF